MASISSQIRLMDVVSAPLANISGALGNVISSFEAMQSACDSSVDVANFTEARNKILEASAEVGRLEEKLQSLTSPDINIPVKWDMQSSATMPSFETIQPAHDNSVDIANLAEARNKIVEVSVEVGKLDDQLQNLAPPNIDIPVKWSIQSGTDIFSGTGAERLTNEVQALDDMLDNVLKTQQSIGTQALQIDVLPPEASWDINFINQKVEELGNKMSELQSIDTSGFNDTDISQLSNSYENLRSGMSQIINIQESMNQAIANGDVSALNNGYNELSGIAERVERQVRNNINTIQELNNIDWQSASSPVTFTTTGLERYKQEIQSANDMISNLTTTQQQIHNQASKTNIFPDSMIVDINQVNDRISKLKSELVSISNRPMDGLGADQASKQIEMLRSQLHQALETQNDLNSAVERMDISSANQAYLKLNSTIDTTERNIRDNFGEQTNFNTSIDKGVTSASKLESKIASFIAAYASIRTIGEVINLSDRMTQTSARLEMIVDDGGSVQELQNKIYAVAQDTRADYMGTADIISKLGIQASKAFTTNDELLAFTEQLNKQFTIAGSTQQEISSASLQLSQALGSGVLRGEELNAVFEAAPNVIQTIADYLGEDIGAIREMASEGQITADVVKNAMLAAAEETNAKFAQMPMTFGQVFTGFKNDALMAFQPILNKLSEFANSESFNIFVNNFLTGFSVLAGAVIEIFDIIMAVGGFLYDNWSIIGPVILGVATALTIYAGYLAITNGLELISKGLKIAACIASFAHAAATGTEATATAVATAAQYGLNTALLACPLTWIIIAIIAIIAIVYAVVAAINKFAGTSISATGIIMGALAVAGAFIWDLFLGVLDLILGVINALINPFIRVANFIGNVFTSPISSIIYGFHSMADGVLAMLEKIASAMDYVFGSTMADTVANWRSGLKEMADAAVKEYAPNENYQNVIDELDLSVEDLGLKRIEYDDAWDAGYKFGEGIDDKIANFDPSNLFGTDVPGASDYTSDYTYTPADELTNGVGDIADNTSDIKDAVDISQEDLKYLRDIAERDVINRFTTAEIHVDMGGVTNTVNKDTDLDGVVDYMVTGIEEAMAIVAEGVHE